MQRQIEEQIRVAIYEHFIARGSAPSAAWLMREYGLSPDDCTAVFAALSEQRAIVRDADGEIWMAIPFSASATDVLVRTAQVSWWANCAFDGLGIPAMLGCDAIVETVCPQSRAPIRVTVEAGVPQSDSCVLHMGVPLARWWDDIGDT